MGVNLISHSQNQEDILLFNALSEIDTGVYVDVGASDPVIDSVTKLFYDRGWRGINIEPSVNEFILLKHDRPEDINLDCAVGNADGMSEIHLSPRRRRNSIFSQYTTVDSNQVSSMKVSTLTLNSILNNYGFKNKNIHFLKIDVKGSEKFVLEGLDLAQYRPWIIVIDCLNPTTKINQSYLWDNLILNHEYAFAHFDGLNNYYVANEHSKIGNKINRVNVLLTDYETSCEVKNPRRIQKLEEEMSERINSTFKQTKLENIDSQAEKLELKRVNQDLRIQSGIAGQSFFQTICSKNFLCIDWLRKLYALVVFLKDPNLSSAMKLSRISQYLKKTPTLRKFLIQFFYVMKIDRRMGQRTKRKASALKISSTVQIDKANQIALERSFTLINPKS